MSDDGTAAEAAGADDGPLRRVYDTITPGFVPHPNAGMGAIGWTLFAGIVLLLVPFLPLLVLVWLISKAGEAVAGR